MWPLVRDGLKAFLFDPAFAKKVLRSSVMALAAGGVAYADKVAAVVGPGSDAAVHKVKIASMVAMGLVLMFGGGDSTLDTVKKNPDAVRAALGLDAPAEEKQP